MGNRAPAKNRQSARGRDGRRHDERQGRLVARLEARQRNPRRSVGHPRGRLRRGNGELPQTLGIEGVERIRPQRLQRRRLHAGGSRKGDERNNLESALPQRQNRKRQIPAPAATVLLRVVLAAGHHPPLPFGAQRLVGIYRQSGNTAQRHTPRHRNPRTYAPVDGRTQSAVGRSVGDVRKDFRIHKPHASARSTRKVVGELLRKAPPAPPANHLRNQRALDGQGKQALPHRPAQARMPFHHRRGNAENGADGVSGGSGQLQRKRRRRAPHRTAEGIGSARLLRSIARKVQQQDKRRNSAPLA